MSSAMAVTDTHSLLWYATGQASRLGRGARRHFQRADDGNAVIYVPVFVLAEVSELRQLGRVRLQGSFEEWLAELVASRRYIPVDLTLEMIRAFNSLFDIPERGDRLIAATAVAMEMPLITRDGEIAACARVARVWD